MAVVTGVHRNGRRIFFLTPFDRMTTLVQLYRSPRSPAMSHQESPPGQPLSTADKLVREHPGASSPAQEYREADASRSPIPTSAAQNPANSNLLPNKLPQTPETQENG